MNTKTYTIRITRVVRPKIYKLEIFNPNSKVVVAVNFGDNFDGLINYIRRFLENKKEEF